METIAPSALIVAILYVLSRWAFASVTAVDYGLFRDINDLMFRGPFVAERDVAVGDFLRRHPEAGDPVVRDLVLGSAARTAARLVARKLMLSLPNPVLQWRQRRRDPGDDTFPQPGDGAARRAPTCPPISTLRRQG